MMKEPNVEQYWIRYQGYLALRAQPHSLELGIY